MNLYPIIRPLLFRLDPEQAHHLTLQALQIGYRLGITARVFPSPVSRPCKLMGLEFPNRVGLAAGLDKNGDYIDALAALGFGFLEIGTVTPRPQPGNPPPRLFRLPRARAIINRMGFNNKGVDHLVSQAKRARFRGILGINIGKNFDTPLERAADDYLLCMRKVYPVAGYITLNISSPNTPGLRNLQQRDSFSTLIGPLKEEQSHLQSRYGRYVPLVVKIAPDLEPDEIATMADLLSEYGIDAVIATNTTLDHRLVEQLPHGTEQGGVSGAPLRQRSTRVIEQLSTALDGRLPVIGAGGILSGKDACEKIAAGASLIQIYTGLIYTGPSLIREITEQLVQYPDLQ